MIQNQPKNTKDPEINALRDAFEHRATWMYLLIDEAVKNGLDIDFAKKAIRRCGCFHGQNKYTHPADLKTFASEFVSETGKKIFEMDTTLTDDEFKIDFHYCPLVTGWTKQTDDPELLKKLCDIAMEGDRGIVDQFDNLEFHLGDTIAYGKPTCQVCIRRKK